MKLLFVVAFVAIAVISVEGHWAKHKRHHTLKKLGHEVGHELKKFEDIPRVLTNIKVADGCQCVNYDCGCCGRMVIKKLKFDETICANASYLPKEYGIRVTLTLNDLTLLNQTISAKNPPPLCAGVPHVKELSVCIRFYNLSVGNFSFSGCVDLEAHVLHFIEEKYVLGCFKVGDGPKLTGNNDIKLVNQQLRGSEPVVKNSDSLLFDRMRFGVNRGHKMT